MPKYYCDYCDAFLTRESTKLRKTHNEGRRHKDSVRAFYQKWMEAQAQKMVDATARAFTEKRMQGAIPRTTLGMAGPPPPVAHFNPPMGMMPSPMRYRGYPGGGPPQPLMDPRTGAPMAPSMRPGQTAPMPARPQVTQTNVWKKASGGYQI